jgi:hypothetical protein
MFRLLFVMVTTVLVGLGSGYFLWGSRVARLTESLSGLTLELDTMRARLAAPRAEGAEEGGVKAADELRVINESMAAFRVELAEQKALLEKAAVAAAPADSTTANAQLPIVRRQLEECMADKADLEQRLAGGAQRGYAAPTYQAPAQAPAYPAPTYRQPPPAEAIPDYEAPPER